ncbi:MAG: hypothetical protein DMG41_23435, partial [Acidobacteria bacterium]
MKPIPQFLERCRLSVFLLALGPLFSARTPAQTAESYRQRAIELSRAKLWDEAIASYHQALELAPDDAQTHYNLALALKYKGDNRQAVDEFETTLRLKPKWEEAHYGLGSTWYDLEDLSAARKELRKAVELNPKNAPAHRLLGRIYSQQNDFSSAEGELRQALALKPSAETHFEL